jgi:hypothetical protein
MATSRPAGKDAVPLTSPDPDKPERIATKAPRHKEKMLIIIKLGALVSWWQKYFV